MLSILISFTCALLVSLIAGFVFLPVIRKLKAKQQIREDGPQSHLKKAGTPTLGGVFFITGIIVAIIVAGAGRMSNGDFTHLYIAAFSMIFAAIGFVDDWQKIKNRRNLGLTSLQKLLMQIAAAILFVFLMRYTGSVTMNLYIPFVNASVALPEWLYLIFAAFVTVAEVNAVNLTDGEDGLCAGVTIPVAAFFVVIAIVWDERQMSENYLSSGIFAAAAAGGLVAFLAFNFHPARVFMGDVGSHFLGGCVAALSFAFDMPLILIVVGLIYLLESLSDVIQVLGMKLSRRLTGKAKRVFKMAPIHHHFELCGWSEYKIFFVFTVFSIVCCAAGVYGVMQRFGI